MTDYRWSVVKWALGIAVDADGNAFVAEGPASRPTAGGGVTKYSKAMH